MKTVVLTVMLITGPLLSCLWAQKQTWILHSGERIQSEYTTFSNPQNGVPYLIFDGTRIEELSKIKYITDDSLRYRVKGIYRGDVNYLPRIVDGPSIDIYQKEYKKNNLSLFNIGRKNKIDYYFEKDESSIDNFSYPKLKAAIEDKPASLAVLKKANKYRWVEMISLAVSAAAAIHVMRAEIGEFPRNTAALSVISLIPVALVQKPKERVYFEAIHRYNAL